MSKNYSYLKIQSLNSRLDWKMFYKNEGVVLQHVFSLFSFLFSKNDFEFASCKPFFILFSKYKNKMKNKSSVKSGNFEKQKKLGFVFVCVFVFHLSGSHVIN